MIFRLWFIALFVTLFTNCSLAQTSLNAEDIVRSLQGLESGPRLNAAILRQQAIDNVRSGRNEGRVNRSPLSEELNRLPQFTVEISFNFDSAVIRPESYRTLGAMADALHNPVMLGYRFLIVGHTDAKGSRKYNLELSQRRADAIREALVTTFRVPLANVEAVGLGEEQLRDSSHPDAAANRRVQIVTIGKR
jgi:outer membrane protein OmpA-like peptidoglycan-associated protein